MKTKSKNYINSLKTGTMELLLQQMRLSQDLTAIKNVYNTKKGAKSQFKILIKNLSYCSVNDTIFLVIYEEWQNIEKKGKGRLYTALFQRKKTSLINLNGFTFMKHGYPQKSINKAKFKFIHR
jgi:hypothetical protein